MKKAKSSPVSRGASRRARELADVARTLDEKKGSLPYGEFEKWALKAFPRYPIQVLRYLRKAHRVFGRDLARLLERLGQKKVFLLVGLDDPWAPLKDGIPSGTSREKQPLEQFSVSQLRRAIRARTQTESQAQPGWGTLGSALERISTLWPRVQKTAPASALRRDSARKQLERFRALLSEALTHLDQVLTSNVLPGKPAAPRANPLPAPKATRVARASRRDSGFLD